MIVERFRTLNNRSTKKEFSYEFDLKGFMLYLVSCEYSDRFGYDELMDEINKVNKSIYKLNLERKMRVLLSSYLSNKYSYLFTWNLNRCITIDRNSYSLNCIYPCKLEFRKTDTEYVFLLSAIPISESYEKDYTIDKESNKVLLKSSRLHSILLELKFKITDIDLFDEDKLLFNLLMNYLEFQESENKSL